jgi:hypothetical protein
MHSDRDGTGHISGEQAQQEMRQEAPCSVGDGGEQHTEPLTEPLTVPQVPSSIDPSIDQGLEFCNGDEMMHRIAELSLDELIQLQEKEFEKALQDHAKVIKQERKQRGQMNLLIVQSVYRLSYCRSEESINSTVYLQTLLLQVRGIY